MPANLPPQARAAERRYIEAKNLPDRIRYLQEFISSIPEHKGNEKMRGYLRRRLAQLKDELEGQRKRRAGGSGGGGFSFKKEGAAQVVILGMTGSGKSSLLMKVTNAKTEVADHPFTTREPVPGMMPFEDIQFQLIDTPAIFENVRDGAWGSQLLSLARNADGLLILLDAADSVNQFKLIVNELTSAGITIDRKVRKIEIERTTGGGIQIACTGRITCRVDEIDRTLKEFGVRNAVVRIWGDVTLEEVEDALDQTRIYKPSLIVVNKVDRFPGALENFHMACNKEAIEVSTATGEGLNSLGESLFRAMGIMRAYTKGAGGEVAEKPIIMKTGARVKDIAKIVHSQLYRNFKYARVWGNSVNFNGERVGAEHELADKDVLEIHMK
ncbi:MAG: TGS domain-containing protein [Candidatus Verstraetearchaeota archaeon]|nr:TGS domain-containing protein [Candidatus Verstraetearchaeota archaeon]